VTRWKKEQSQILGHKSEVKITSGNTKGTKNSKFAAGGRFSVEGDRMHT
jgi:hypothetical protein